MTPSELRAYVLERDGGCVWPGCTYEVNGINPLQCAHLQHRGMGGSKERNRPDNAVTLCALHHRVFDGTDGSATTRWELASMLATAAGIKR